jgi:hypothetical protein
MDRARPATSIFGLAAVHSNDIVARPALGLQFEVISNRDFLRRYRAQTASGI